MKKWLKRVVVAALIVPLLFVGMGTPIIQNKVSQLSVGFIKNVLTVGFANVAYAASLDYTCTGTADDAVIQQALTDLPATGGEIDLLAGNYNFTVTSTVSRTINNVTFVGSGYATYLAENGSHPLISAGSQTGWMFKDIRTDAGWLTLAADTIVDTCWKVGTLVYVGGLETEIGGKVATTTTVNGHALSENVTVTNGDLGAVPTTTTVNGHALSTNVTVTANDVLPSQTGNSGKYLSTDGSNPAWSSTVNATWGGINGTLTNQTDLNTTLTGKLSTANVSTVSHPNTIPSTGAGGTLDSTWLSLSTSNASAVGTTNITSTNRFYSTAANVTLATGTWLVNATILVQTAANVTTTTEAILWNGTTTINSDEAVFGGKGLGKAVYSFTLAGIVVSAGNEVWRIAAASTVTGSNILPATVSNGKGNNATTIIAIRID
jgi:hypothetical protein